MIIVQIIYNLCILISISVLTGFIDQRWKRTTNKGASVQGILFGIAIIIGMLNPFVFEPGVIFDGRSVLLSLCALFFGPIASFIATLIALAYRIYIGGFGVYMGTSVILFSSLIGLFFYYFRNKLKNDLSILNLFLLGLIVHIVMILLMLLLPSSIQFPAFKKLSITILLFYPLATIIIGKILKDQEENSKHLKEIEANEKRYRDLIEFAVGGILIGSHEGIITDANSYFCFLTGKKREDFIGHHISEVVFTPESLKKSPLRFDLLKDGKVIVNERNILRPDGTEITIEMHTKMMPDGTYQSIYHDITNKKKIENELLKSEEKFRSLVEATSDLIWETNLNGKFTYISPQVSNLLGYTQDEVIGKSPFDFMPAEEANVVMKRSAEIVALQQPYNNLVNINLHKSGNTVVFETSGVPVFDTNGKLIGYRGIDRDITNRIKDEEKLNILSFAVQQSPVSVIITDLNGNIQYINPKVTLLTGYTLQDLIGKNHNIFHVNTNEINISEIIISVKEWHGEHQCKKKNGEIFWEWTYVLPIHNSQGTSIRYLIIKEDITERKLTEFQLKEKSKEIETQNKEYIKINKELINAKQRAEESDRLKTVFLANMSHEIRTPMNGILGFADLLKKPKLSIKQQLQYIQIIELSGKRMLNIINDIINISKIEAGQMDISIEDTEVNTIIDQCYLFFEIETQLKNIELIKEKELKDDDCIILTDKTKLSQILINLIKNSIKFTQAGSIHFGYKKKNDNLEFYIKDTGIGISNEQTQFIFERFRQGSENLTRNYEGAGLGLSISKAYVEMMGGKIWLESQPDKGTTFYFTLPFNKALNKTISKPVIMKPVSIENKEPFTILIADDDENSKLYLVELLNEENLHLLLASDGNEAIELFHTNPTIDLILMDIKMPVTDGLEASKQIKLLNTNIPIIAITAYAMKGDEEIIKAAGCDFYISKPVNQSVLMGIIKDLIAKKSIK